MPSFDLSCVGKQAFDNRGAALKVQRIRKMRRSNRSNRSNKGDKMSPAVYECRVCGKWHMGSMYLG